MILFALCLALGADPTTDVPPLVALVVGALGLILAGGGWALWRVLQPAPKPPPDNVHALDDATRRRVRADIERRHEHTKEARVEVEEAKTAPTPDDASRKLEDLLRKPPRRGAADTRLPLMLGLLFVVLGIAMLLAGCDQPVAYPTGSDGPFPCPAVAVTVTSEGAAMLCLRGAHLEVQAEPDGAFVVCVCPGGLADAS